VTLPAGINANWLKQRFGAGLSFVDRNGIPFPDSVFDFQLCAAADWIEMELGVVIGPRSVVGERYNVTNITPPWFNTRPAKNRPVREVTGIRFRWGNNPQAQEIPYQWGMVRQNRLIEIVPDYYTPFVPNPNVVWLNTYALPWSNNMIPGFLEIDYEAGFDGVTLPVPPSLLNALGLKAIVLALVALGNQLFPPGTTNLSRSQDGLSQSRGTTQSANSVLFGAQIKLYQDLLAEQMVTLRGQFGGSVKFGAI